MFKKIIVDMLSWVFIVLTIAFLGINTCYIYQIVKELKVDEKVETFEVTNISYFDPNSIGRVYLDYNYIDESTGKQYIGCCYTPNKSGYKVGDKITVITRDHKYAKLVEESKLGRARTKFERILDLGYENGEILFDILIIAINVLLWIKIKHKLKELYTSRKIFTCVTTSLYLFSIILGVIYYIAAEESHDWDGLGYAVMSMALTYGSSILYAIIWVIASIINYKITKASTANNTNDTTKAM